MASFNVQNVRSRFANSERGEVLTNPQGDRIYFARSIDYVYSEPDSVFVISNLFFKNLEGKTHNMRDVAVDTPIKDVIARYGRDQAIEVDWLRFLYGSKQLWPNSKSDGKLTCITIE